MRRTFRPVFCALFGLAVLTLCSCGKTRPPSLTEVEGMVLLNGKPLPNAQVEFQPELPKWKGEYNSFATTDENGHFQMVCGHMQQAGAAVGKHRVLVSEPPVPSEYRSLDGQTREKYTRYLAGLQNRPIPPEYGTANTTPLTIEVTADKKTYNLDLKR
ncbi:MAG TPA: DUF6795 domain-containing protein [Gemmataceae bacterium]|nr:DUF6795 domain-containing protein [Gemmataceae bacterium]